MSHVLLGRFSIGIDRQLSAPLALQICQQLRSAITGGQLDGGLELPSTRELALHLGVSRNTMSAAYDQLSIEGYLHLSRGRRPVVARLANIVLQGKGLEAGKGSGLLALSNWALGLSLHTWPVSGEAGHRPLLPGLGDEREFPQAIWARCLRRAALRSLQAQASEATSNRPKLQRVLLEHLQAHRGVNAEARQVFILPTAQAALDLIARVVLNPGQVAWVENPGYEGATAAFEAAGASVVGMDLDQHGLMPSGVESATAQAPRCIFLTPSHQYPTGRLMPVGRRLSLLQFAAQAGAYVIEDDYDGDFHYQGKPVAALQGLDSADQVFYVGTFSKTLHMGVRVGYLVAPCSLVDIVEKAQWHTGQTVSLTLQDALAAFIDEGHYSSHIRKMSRIYKSRRDHLCDGLLAMDAGLAVVRPEGGMQILAELGASHSDEGLVRRLAAAGVSVRPLSRHYVDKAPRQGMFLGFAAWNEMEIDSALTVIAKVLREGGD